jgi:hypothetical protein
MAAPAIPAPHHRTHHNLTDQEKEEKISKGTLYHATQYFVGSSKKLTASQQHSVTFCGTELPKKVLHCTKEAIIPCTKSLAFLNYEGDAHSVLCVWCSVFTYQL